MITADKFVTEENINPGIKKISVNNGLPPLRAAEKWAYFEYWPLVVFYTPVFFYWLYLGMKYRSLGLPLLANPNIPLGGMVGESKTQILDGAGDYAQTFILPYTVHCKHAETDPLWQATEALALAERKSIQLPLVAKPDRGCRGRAIRVIKSASDLQAYLESFPSDKKYILQKMAPWQAEAGLFYVRRPGARKGKIISITLKYRPTVMGDGKRTLEQLVVENPRLKKLAHVYLENTAQSANYVPVKGEEIALTFAGSHCRGSIFRNGAAYYSEALENAVDAVMRDFPAFYYGRLDVKFENISLLREGKNFCVIEVNGASSEATHIWDSQGSIREVYATLFRQYRTLFEIGAELRESGLSPPSAFDLIREWITEQRAHYPKGQ